MPVSDAPQSTFGVARTLYAMLVVSVLLCWLNQDSIKLYCQQKYHQSCEVPVLGGWSLWRLGADLSTALGEGRDSFLASLSDREQQADQPPTVNLPATAPVVTVDVSTAPAPQPPLPVQPAASAAPSALSSDRPVLATLAEGDEVFLVGDSLMQGVAPHLANSLLRRHKVRTVNLSRQSTGLSYPGFFNWPRTVADTLAQHPHIRLMVVFLGANDPWDMPQGKGKPFVYFKSPLWEQTYRARIDAILQSARDHHVQVIWVGPPNMSTPRLSQAMAYLSELYQQQTGQYGQHYVSANPFLGYTDEQFSASVPGADGTQVKVRGDDGIHFTITGQKMIASQLMALIGFSGLIVTGH
ncbi:SGNH/GDSL hydrolase family protein [Pseudomonas cremoricolorata]|uniref:SGNH/GDSL hydrolase family protein n=1 Tax=Pseudomonas cremoricolorata TaxID=157783 RepID=UPI00042839EC|nr:SGNH family hydrolase [Pseudomonas cremoricolorata]